MRGLNVGVEKIGGGTIYPERLPKKKVKILNRDIW